jgi:hypothetical protein
MIDHPPIPQQFIRDSVSDPFLDPEPLKIPADSSQLLHYLDYRGTGDADGCGKSNDPPRSSDENAQIIPSGRDSRRLEYS